MLRADIISKDRPTYPIILAKIKLSLCLTNALDLGPIFKIHLFCGLFNDDVHIHITESRIGRYLKGSSPDPIESLSCNPILFAICTSTFSKLCKYMYTVACRRVLSSAPL
jgi:hypothetical protein